MKLLLQSVGYILLAAIPMAAQETHPVPSVTPPAEIIECTPELFNVAEKEFQARPFRGSGFRAEKSFQKFLADCPGSPLLPEVVRRLSILHEEFAEHSFYIANYYLEKYRTEGTGLRGAQARYRMIFEKYPNYSKIDEVIYLIGETYLLEKKFGEALKYFQIVIDKFPDSESAIRARVKVTEMSILPKSNGNAPSLSIRKAGLRD